jgi:polysaccharide deacetylase family protein (PEP-CTERM system associated)
MINCLSFDIEGFVESNLQSFTIEKPYIDRRKEIYEIEKNTDSILELLDSFNCKATFFILDSVISDLPNVVKKITALDHEIAIHGPEHIRIFDKTPHEFREKLKSAKKHLEDIVSKPIYGFRAPDFSITELSLWALDILQEEGFIYDSSIYPFGFHDVYGMKNVQPFIHRLQNGLIEFPLSTIKLFGLRLPFGGGGYFRLYPLFLTKIFIKNVNKLDKPCIMYIHPYEVGSIIPDIPTLSRYRKFRHYYNCKNGCERLGKILSKYEFCSAIEVLSKENILR